MMTSLATTIPNLLARRRELDGDLQAVVTIDGSATFSDLDCASSELGARLVGAGVANGDRVALLAPNEIEWVVVALAVMRIGAVLVPLSTLLRPPELIAQLNAASVTQLIATPRFKNRRYLDELEAEAAGLPDAVTLGQQHPAVPSLRRLWTVDALPDDVANPDLSEYETQVGPDDDMVVLFTSGSRSTPKGVIHTHGAALRAVTSGLEARCVRRGERLYIPMPFFWTGGFGQGLLTVLAAGATLLTEPEPEPGGTLDFLERERVTLFRGWPDQAARLAAHPRFADTDLSSLRDGSLPAVLPPERRSAPGARATLLGMTETFGPYAGARLDVDLPPEKFGSCGKPFTGVVLRIIDPDSGHELVSGQEGEIVVSGDHLLRGICGRPRSDVFTDDGAYRTGDLGRLDEDGYLWFAGRLDDMVKIKGATVYPSEIEAALRAIGEVREAFVTDVPRTDGHREMAALVVTGEPVERIKAELRERLSAFKVPTRWLLATESSRVPMLASGKVDKTALQRLLADEGRP
jgi:acyl-CoA synthetase (AMP-forming)/AMP-acid ligase II